jgi:hypothetical protein
VALSALLLRKIPSNSTTSPLYGTDIAENEWKGFDVKLIQALGHQQSETVVMAVLVPGKRKSVNSPANTNIWIQK